MSEVWKPAVTVAAIISRMHNHVQQFFMIEETTSAGIRINQAAGHLEPNETLIQAVIRETLEETAHEFVPTALVGAYLSRYVSPSSGKDVTYLRFAFCGELGQQHDIALDDGILRTLWMTYEELIACKERHRSDLVMQCIDDYIAGKRAPLTILHTHQSALGALGTLGT